MECSNESCKKRYDLKCLKITLDAFKKFTIDYKKKWVCPECICSNPKSGNVETPVRSNLCGSNIATTPSNNINTQRGSQVKFSPTMLSEDVDSDSVLLDQLTQFRSDIIARLDNQSKAITLLQNQFLETKSDLANLIKIMTVIENKISSKFNDQSQDMDSNRPIATPCTYAEASSKISRNSTTNKSNVNTQKSSKMQKVNKDGAIKSAVFTTDTIISNPSITDLPIDKVDHNQAGWTAVRSKKPHRLLRNVGFGVNAELKAIRATEKKKFLHVWRLHPDTTLEALTNHVKGICGQEVVLEVDQIKHKTERGYSSFRIGIPEKVYPKLNNAEAWPVNAEFNEWIFFRGSNNKSDN